MKNIGKNVKVILAQCLNFLERHEESIKYSNLAISIDPQHFDSFLIRGIHIYLFKGSS